ncbi:OmpA/MotB domain protein [Mycolicibacterium rhodesiae JS60]|nr:OmpA/MotB domain protein [Mycolicibacterium rhodesiae JS60]
MPAASTASASPALGPNGAPAVRDITHNAAEPALPMTPTASSNRVDFDHATNPHINWNTAIEAKNTPDGSQSFQCIGTTAKWMTAAPIEATAAQRAASRLSVFLTSLTSTASTVT